MTTDSTLIVVPSVPPSMNPWQRMCWQQQMPIKHRWNRWLQALCLEQQIPRLDRIKLDIAVYYGDARWRDWDNGAIAFKLIQDGLVRGGVLLDDNTRHIERPLFPDICLDRKNPRTEITITPTE